MTRVVAGGGIQKLTMARSAFAPTQAIQGQVKNLNFLSYGKGNF